MNVPFLKATQERLREYLQWREENDIDCDALFFARKNGEWTRMSKQSLTLRIRKIGEIIGIGDFRPHSIRKSRLNIIGKKNIKKAASLAHHESIDTTYIHRNLIAILQQQQYYITISCFSKGGVYL